MRTHFFLVFSLISNLLSAQLLLPSIFSNKMVLQQQSTPTIWGKALPNEKVELITGWNNRIYEVNASPDSLWFVKVETPMASFNTYTIRISSGNESKTLNKVLIGEVWLCSGQSNMAMRMKGFSGQPVNNSQQDIASSQNDFLVCYDMERVSSIRPRKDTKGRWFSADPTTTAEFPAVGYYFGRHLQQTLNVPVGLLHCSWGGSYIQAWMSSDAIRNFSTFPIPQTEEDNVVQNKTPTVIYNGMIESVLGYGMCGVLWYQGESNRLDYKMYPDLFGAMHDDWIAKWNIGDFPIYLCQIAPYNYGVENSALMREAQLKIVESRTNNEIAILSDVGEENFIHPANKRQVGERLAYIALNKNYGFNTVEYKSPAFNSFQVENGVLTISFDNASGGLSAVGNHPENFEIAGNDRKFYPANAEVFSNTVKLSSEFVPVPVAARYGFKNFFIGSLFGANGLPVSSFRTDNWTDEARMTITTSKNVGQTLRLSINAAATDQSEVWVDANDNGVKDDGESVVVFGTSSSASFQNYTIGSQTVTIYGNVTQFECSANSLTAIDVTGNERLQGLRCHKNNLSELDVTANKNLTLLYCNDNIRLERIDVSQNSKLTSLSCSANNLSVLDVSNNPNLVTLFCFDNKLTALDLTNNSKLTNVRLYRNNFSACELDTIYLSLSVADSETLPTISIKHSGFSGTQRENPGSDGSRYYIATKKGWIVQDLTGNVVLTNTSYACNETSIKEIESFLRLGFYPNPSKGFIMINGLEKLTTIVIYNLQAEILRIEQILPRQVLNISDLPKGMYIIRVDNQLFKLIRE